MTDHRIENNPSSSFENKQRSFSNISYMVFFTYFTIYGVIITGLSSYPFINRFCQDSWHIGVDRDWRECKDRQLLVEIARDLVVNLYKLFLWIDKSKKIVEALSLSLLT